MVGRTVGHYRILERLGGGGMGVVYKAEDLTLQRTVALKFLPPELTRDDQAKQRFLVEARAAARLDHPNICNVFEIAESDDGQTFIAMAFYGGESLAKRLERGPLSVEEAAKIAVEVARGLGAAHQAGIIHRDIKPANVMLTANGSVKIVDFGVAKLAGVTMTHGAGSPGTLAYMAPEQIRGEPVTPATDLWALGAVFYEMLTGSRPFRGDYEQAVAYTILNEQPGALDQTLPTCSPALVEMIERALTKDPTKRFQTADDFVAAVESISSARAVVVPTPLPKAGFGPVAIVIALLAVVAVAVGYWVLRERSPASEIPEAPAPSGSTTVPPELQRVAVAVFDNRTGDPSLDAVGQMAADWISEGISNTGALDVVSTASVLEFARTRRTGEATAKRDATRDLAEATRATLVVSGSYYVSGDALQIQTSVTDVSGRGVALHIEPASGSRSNPLAVVDLVRQRVVDALAARYLDKTVDLLREGGRPPRYEAYREYLTGISKYGSSFDSAVAIAHFRRALELDPGFVKPRFQLMIAYWDGEDLAAVDKELEQLERQSAQLTPIDSWRLKRFQAYQGGRIDEAVRADREVVRLAPGDPWENYLLATDLLQTNLPREAIRVLAGPIDWDAFTVGQPAGAYYFTVLAGAHHMLAEYEAELGAVAKGRRLYGNNGGLLRAEASALAGLGRTDQIDRLLSDASLSGEELTVLHDVAMELGAHDQRDRSKALWNRGASMVAERLRTRSRGSEWIPPFDTLLANSPDAVPEDNYWGSKPFLALCLLRAERWDEAEALYEALSAHKSTSTSTRTLHSHMRYLGMLGEIAARRGDHQRARALMRELLENKERLVFGQHKFACARIAAQLGEKDEAVGLLKQAIAEGYWYYPPGFVGYVSYYTSLHRDPAFEPLRGYKPFDDLLEPKG